jgi:DNA-binding NtrC family response regulator
MSGVPDPAPILLVEDRDSLRAMLRRSLEAQGHIVVEAIDQPGAAAAIQQSRPDLVISDLRLPVGDGFGVLRAAKDVDPDLPVIVMTAYGSIQDAVAAMKEGALDFLAKPVDPDHLLLLVERALTQRRMLTENLLLKEELAARLGARRIVGESAALKQVILAVQRAAPSDATVLVEGESGTGKELVARALHALSPRSARPFVAINCAAIPETLLEAELFGYEKGAFTGATARKLGKFEIAHRGTLFLDEIADLPLALQAKILRALENRSFDRLGGLSPVHVDVRIVAATNRNLRAIVATRQFREDLYFRLSVFPIVVPPLRDRRDDIPILARHFVDRVCREVKKRATLSEAAIDALQRYDWPGNVRELQNCIERAIILASADTIQPGHLKLEGDVRQPPERAEAGRWEGFDWSGTLEDVTRRARTEAERRKLVAALADARGNRAQAALALGIPFPTLVALLRERRLGEP